jgi:hypothetical protein
VRHGRRGFNEEAIEIEKEFIRGEIEEVPSTGAKKSSGAKALLRYINKLLTILTRR